MSKNDPKNTVFHKYDVEASIDEIENTEIHSIFKYGFTILSNPKNVRLSIEGTTKMIDNSKERDNMLTKNDKDIPKILSIIYQELFPTFFLLSKSLNVSCPPIQIGVMGAGSMSSENNDMENETYLQENASMPAAIQESVPELETLDIISPNL